MWTILGITFGCGLLAFLCWVLWMLARAQTDGQQSAMGDAIDSIGADFTDTH